MIYSSTIIRTMNLLLQSLAWILNHSLPPVGGCLKWVGLQWKCSSSSVVSLELIQLKSWLTRRLDQANVTAPAGAKYFYQVQNIKILRDLHSQYNQFPSPCNEGNIYSIIVDRVVCKKYFAIFCWYLQQAALSVARSWLAAIKHLKITISSDRQVRQVSRAYNWYKWNFERFLMELPGLVWSCRHILLP